MGIGTIRRFRAITFLISTIALLSTAGVVTPFAQAATFTVFGPETFVREKGKPEQMTRSFSVGDPTAPYTIRIINGDEIPDGKKKDKRERVTSAKILLNGKKIFGPEDFKKTVSVLEKSISLNASNLLNVEIEGKPGSQLIISVMGVDNNPPLITASVNPSPNASGWNNTNVTVTFTCADAESGIASCPVPITVSTEGIGQIVTGASADKAGNATTTSVFINLDKTPPTISGLSFPTPNAAGWNRSDVVIVFKATDSLSGVVGNPAPITVSTEGEGQTATRTATDAAGNAASTTVTVNIDKTPPTIDAMTSPSPNFAGWNKSDATVTFMAQDNISGVANVTSPVTVSVEGTKLITGTATDQAGNVSGTSTLVNLDKTPPVVALSSPSSGFSIVTPLLLVDGTVTDAQNVTINGDPVDLVNGHFTRTLTLTEGSQMITVVATDIAGNTGTASVTGQVNLPPQLGLTTPVNLSIVSDTTIEVAGTIDDPTATVTVNGMQASISGDQFFAHVPLHPGVNLITAVGIDSIGLVGLASISVTRDNVPPQLTIRFPTDNSTTIEERTDVTGFVQDLLSTVSVTVNGEPVEVVVNSYKATGVPLQIGSNTITVVATDALGNATSEHVRVIRQAATGPTIRVLSGGQQSALIGTALSQPLVVQVIDGVVGAPLPGKNVIFKVMENNGLLNSTSTSIAALTDQEGKAEANWTLGTRAGAGRNRVEAAAVGVSGTAYFLATGLVAAPDKINVDAGNNQLGIAGQPLPLPFVAVVTDAGHNRLEGIPVTFTVRDGGGNFADQSAITVTTDDLGRAYAVLTLGLQEGIENNVVEANFAGNTGFGSTFSASGRVAGDPAQTSVSGVVLDNSNQPIEGVTLRIEQTSFETTSDAQGQFRLTGIPLKPFRLIADGRTVKRVGTWPTLEYDMTPVPGIDNSMTIPVYLLPIDIPQGVRVSETEGATLTLKEIPGFELQIAPGSAIFPDGSRSGIISVTPVHADKVPMSPQFGQQPRLIVTIQPAGVQFNPPAKITLPNVDGLAPNEITELYSFDHDAGRFVSIGPGVVSKDGSVITSEPGVGIIKGGWHCGGNPQPTGCCEDKGACGQSSECFSVSGSKCTGCKTTPKSKMLPCIGGDACHTVSGSYDVCGNIPFNETCITTCSPNMQQCPQSDDQCVIATGQIDACGCPGSVNVCTYEPKPCPLPTCTTESFCLREQGCTDQQSDLVCPKPNACATASCEGSRQCSCNVDLSCCAEQLESCLDSIPECPYNDDDIRKAPCEQNSVLMTGVCLGRNLSCKTVCN